MTRCLTSILTLLCLAALPLTAQEGQNLGNRDRLEFNKYPPSPEDKPSKIAGMWVFIYGGPGRAMTMVKLASITSISKQTYMLEGAHQILEVTIDTTGNNTIRFYCLSSDRTNLALDRTASARDIVDKYTDKASRYPAKKYPEATHSHNIEFQLSNVNQVNAVYESVTNAWATNKPFLLHLNP